MEIRSLKSKAKMTTGAVITAAVAIFAIMSLPSDQNSVLAQSQDTQPTGSIQQISASTPRVVVTEGESVGLSINVVGRQGIQGRGSGADVKFSWSASSGTLSGNTDGASVTYTPPAQAGRYTVTVSPMSECVGTATDCTATFTVIVRRSGESTGADARPQNPPGEIPTALADAQGNQYEVFTPESGGTFNGEGFSINAEPGVVPNAEFIGVRMYENGPASNAGMSGHRFTLSGTKYTVAVIDSARAAASSYRLNDVATICVPVPNSLLGNIADVQLVGVSDDGVSLTAMSSSVRVVPSLTVCGYTSTIPVNVAAAIPGTPPALPDEQEIEPAPVLPATGGTSPTSPLVMVWALVIGVALIAASSIALAKRQQDRPTL